MSSDAKFASIDGLEYKEAIARMCGDEELYCSALKMSSQQIPQIIDELDVQVDTCDMSGFAIGVHGLKGALNTIGASALAATADRLCKAAREGSSDTVVEEWNPFKAKIEVFVEKISQI